MKRTSKKEVYLVLLEQGNEIGIKEFVRVLCDVFDTDSLAELSDQIADEFFSDESELGDEY